MRPIDMSKFRKGIQKSLTNVSTGFRDPEIWLDTGSYVMNYLISSKFDGGFPLEGKANMLAGSSGSAKSFIASANCVKDAQKKGIYVVMFDSEAALDKKWLERLGVDTSEERITKFNVSMIDDVAKITHEFISEYKSQYDEKPWEEKPPVLFVIDSLGMLLTPTDKNQFEAGDMKGDMGRKAKALTALMRNLVASVGSEKMGVLFTNHSYESQDQYQPDAVISGGRGIVYASSVIVHMNALKLKEDEHGNSTGSEVTGIRASVQVRKSRYAKPFEKVEIKIPYEHGMNPYSGCFELFEKMGLIKKEGNRYRYNSPVDDYEFFDWRKNYTGEVFNKIMADVQILDLKKNEDLGVNDFPEPEGDE